jgi:hypothetical protein
MKHIFIISLLFLAGISHAASQAPADLSALIEQNLNSVSGQACSMDELSTEGDADWEVRRFFLSISPYVTVGIRGVADLTVTPEIEFVWERISN